MKHWFWDIEAYDNLFLVGLMTTDSKTPIVEMHYLVEKPEDEALIKNAVINAGKKHQWDVHLYNLAKDATRLAWHFKQHIPALNGDNLLSKFLGSKTEEIPPKEDVYFGFNVLHYDIPMIDFALKSVIAGKLKTTTHALRQHSNAIIEGTALPVNTLAYELYANQVDIAYLDDSFTDGSKLVIGLKTLIGMMGGSIIESDSNKSGHSKDIAGDTLYNINDFWQMKEVVYETTKLKASYNIRKGLLNTYADRLLPNNITVNRSSAKFVENIIAPTEPIVDSPVVSFMYPAPHVAKKYGIEPFNILEYTKDWYIKNVYNHVKTHNPKQANYLLGKFLSIYQFYKSVEGKNWNDSSKHKARYGIEAQPKEERRKLMEIFGTYLPLVDKYGNDSYTYVNFSLGGIHGAEVNKKRLEHDRNTIRRLRKKYQYISKIPNKEIDTQLKNILKAQARTYEHSGYEPELLHEIPELFKRSTPIDEIPENITPYGLKSAKGVITETLLDRYKFISSAHTIHQDFAGYYPMLLINLGVFYDGQGVDPYQQVYDERIAIKSKLKELEYGSDEYKLTDIVQEGYKLILNSASGILDGGFDTKCRANNKAMAMRIIGQLFTFIIAQALALEGATIPSSNTDGIYVANIDINTNTAIVNRELEKLLVKIDPHPVFLVSKDTNNRLEIEDGKVTSAKGGTLTSHGGPRVDKRLSHPAICDAVLSRYLSNIGVVDKPIDHELLNNVYNEYIEQTDKRQLLLMTGWLLRPTSGSLIIDSKKNVHKGTIRAFLTKNGMTLQRYNALKKTPSINFDKEVEKLGDDDPMGNAEVIQLLKDLDVTNHWKEFITVREYKATGQMGVPNNQRTVGSVPMLSVVKISGLDDHSRVTLNNESLYDLTDEQVDELYNQLDHEGYKRMIVETCRLWRNYDSEQ